MDGIRSVSFVLNMIWVWGGCCNKRKQLLPAPGGQEGDVIKEALTAVKANTEDLIMLQSFKLDKSLFDVWQVTRILKYNLKIFFTC